MSKVTVPEVAPVEVTPCTVEDCSEPVRVISRGLCNLHYQRLRRYGDVTTYRWWRSAIDRIIDRILVGDGCWVWPGAKNSQGYGRIGAGGRTWAYTHRVVYEALVGPIPDGLDLDHLCRNPSCCNPAHLEPVTRTENSLRGHAARRAEVLA